MPSLDDTFDSLFNVGPECVECGGTDGEMVPTVWTNGEPSHYIHAECKAKRDERRQQEEAQRRADDDFAIRMMNSMD